MKRWMCAWTLAAVAAGVATAWGAASRTDYAEIDAATLAVRPQEAWARAVLFTDEVVAPLSGKAKRLSKKDYYELRLASAGTVWVPENARREFEGLSSGQLLSFGGTVDQISRRYYVIADRVFPLQTQEAMQEHWSGLAAEGEASAGDPAMQGLLVQAQNRLIKMAEEQGVTVAQLVNGQADGGHRIAETIVAEALQTQMREKNQTAEEVMIGSVMALLERNAMLVDPLEEQAAGQGEREESELFIEPPEVAGGAGVASVDNAEGGGEEVAGGADDEASWWDGVEQDVAAITEGENNPEIPEVPENPEEAGEGMDMAGEGKVEPTEIEVAEGPEEGEWAGEDVDLAAALDVPELPVELDMPEEPDVGDVAEALDVPEYPGEAGEDELAAALVEGEEGGELMPEWDDEVAETPASQEIPALPVATEVAAADAGGEAYAPTLMVSAMSDGGLVPRVNLGPTQAELEEAARQARAEAKRQEEEARRLEKEMAAESKRLEKERKAAEKEAQRLEKEAARAERERAEAEEEARIQAEKDLAKAAKLAAKEEARAREAREAALAEQREAAVEAAKQADRIRALEARRKAEREEQKKILDELAARKAAAEATLANQEAAKQAALDEIAKRAVEAEERLAAERAAAHADEDARLERELAEAKEIAEGERSALRDAESRVGKLDSKIAAGRERIEAQEREVRELEAAAKKAAKERKKAEEEARKASGKDAQRLAAAREAEAKRAAERERAEAKRREAEAAAKAKEQAKREAEAKAKAEREKKEAEEKAAKAKAKEQPAKKPVSSWDDWDSPVVW